MSPLSPNKTLTTIPVESALGLFLEVGTLLWVFGIFLFLRRSLLNFIFVWFKCVASHRKVFCSGQPIQQQCLRENARQNSARSSRPDWILAGTNLKAGAKFTYLTEKTHLYLISLSVAFIPHFFLFSTGPYLVIYFHSFPKSAPVWVEKLYTLQNNVP